MLDGAMTGPLDKPEATAPPISSLLSPIQIDPLTVADDPELARQRGQERNLPGYLAPGLRALYEA